MNRLILIGNGFDLAHGMKTTYIDFIQWYLTEMLCGTICPDRDDRLLSIRINGRNRDFEPLYCSRDVINDWVCDLNENGFNLSKFGPQGRGYDGVLDQYPFIITVKSSMFGSLVGHCAIHRWVDVEAVFYETLISILNGGADSGVKEDELTKLNDDMRELIGYLKQYLCTIESPKPIEEYHKIFTAPIQKDDLESRKEPRFRTGYTEKEQSNTMVLNFNYTSTVETYFDEEKRKARGLEINYINGTIFNDQNPIIFGFGDELDKSYKQIEEEKAKGWFEHIKSFGYLRTSNYRNLVRFVDGSDYQIIILGHSCGLSDRTMLHMLMEHPNCRSIKIYYYGTEEANNYTEITYEIARHFNDKSLMRKRIVNLTRSTRMPQFDD